MCGHRSFQQSTTQTIVDDPGRKEISQRRVCSNPACRHHFKAEAIWTAERPPEPPRAA